MRRIVFVVIAIVALVFSQAVDAQRGTRDAANPTPLPTQDSRERTSHLVVLAASGDWIHEQANGNCRLNVPASKQELTIVLSDGEIITTPMPRGELTAGGNCEFRIDVKFLDSQSYEFYLAGNLVAESDGAFLNGSVPLTIKLDVKPEPTPAPTSESRPTPRPTPAPQPTNTPEPEELDWTFTPRIEGVKHAEIVIFSNVKESALFSEPIALTFVGYQFESENIAADAMVTLCSHAEESLQLLTEAKYLKEVSIGRIGDDRCAFNVDEPDSSMSMWSVVRSGDQILVTLALGIGGDYPTYVGDFLEGHIEMIEENDSAILPELADLPRGWEAGPPPEDVTDESIPLGD